MLVVEPLGKDWLVSLSLLVGLSAAHELDRLTLLLGGAFELGVALEVLFCWLLSPWGRTALCC